MGVQRRQQRGVVFLLRGGGDRQLGVEDPHDLLVVEADGLGRQRLQAGVHLLVLLEEVAVCVNGLVAGTVGGTHVHLRQLAVVLLQWVRGNRLSGGECGGIGIGVLCGCIIVGMLCGCIMVGMLCRCIIIVMSRRRHHVITLRIGRVINTFL